MCKRSLRLSHWERRLLAGINDLTIAIPAFMTAFLSTSLFHITRLQEQIASLTVGSDPSSTYNFVSMMTAMSPIRTLFIPFSYYGNVPKYLIVKSIDFISAGIN
jgi:hypothetical protein